MTDTLEPSAPAARPRPPRRRAPPAASNGHTDPVVAELLARIEQLEQQPARVPYVDGQPANIVAGGRVADDAELTPWQRQVRERTRPKDPVEMVRTEPAYNVPERWYMKPDGEVVSLQGDSRNLAYYTDVKGFHLLSREEEQHYLTVEKPKIVRLQQQRANLINGIRRAVQLDPVLAAGLDPSWEIDLDHMTVAELQSQFDEIASTPTSDGRQRKMFKRLPRLQDADDRRAEAEQARLLAGVESTPPRGYRPNGRTIEVTAENSRTFA